MTISSAKESIESNTPSFSLCKKEGAVEWVGMRVEVLVMELNEFLNIGRKMTVPQIKETTAMILKNYYFLNIADINIALDRIKTGQVQLFEGLDGTKILKVLGDYVSEKQELAETISMKSHELTIVKSEKIVPAPEVAKILKKIRDRLFTPRDGIAMFREYSELQEFAAEKNIIITDVLPYNTYTDRRKAGETLDQIKKEL